MAHSYTGKPEVPPSSALVLNIALDFSKTPGGRYRAEGPYSGEEFRENVLLPRFNEAVERNVQLYVDLDGGYGYPSSFLEEAFGGLVRLKKSVHLVEKNITFGSSEEPYLVDDILRYIREALIK